MEYTFSKDVKFRKEQNSIFICNCKLLQDYKIRLKYFKTMNKINRGVSVQKLNKDEKPLFNDFMILNFLKPLYLKEIKTKNYKKVYNFLKENIPLKRSYAFLLNKLKNNPKFFMGLYLDEELIGVIQGFHRDDYTLLSEIAVDLRFRGRGFGSKLLHAFEKKVKGKLKVGALDDVIHFYEKCGYSKSIQIQIPWKLFQKMKNAIKHIKILSLKKINNLAIMEISIKDKHKLLKLVLSASIVSKQYIFTKCI